MVRPVADRPGAEDDAASDRAADQVGWRSRNGDGNEAGSIVSGEDFKPFVRQLGEHLDGWGNVCRCQRGPSVPADTQSPNIKTAPAVSPAKPTRVPTWADHEMQQAERKGH